jgi:hypothetical protein
MLFHPGMECIARCEGIVSGTPCSLAFGSCGCVFHKHCIAPWAMRHDTCPIHETGWEPTTPRLVHALTGGGAPAAAVAPVPVVAQAVAWQQWRQH